MLAWALALRYLLRKPITLFALMSVMIGTTAFIVVVGVMDGYVRAFNDKSREVLSDIIVMPMGSRIAEADNVCRFLKAASPDVVACSADVSGLGLLKVRAKDGTFSVKWVRYQGVDPVAERAVTGVDNLTRVPQGAEDWILPGAGLIDPLSLDEVKEIQLVTTGRYITGPPRKTALVPAGLVEFGLHSYDREFCYVPRSVASALAGLEPDQATEIRVRIRDAGRGEEVKARLQQALDRRTHAQPLTALRYQEMSTMFRALKLQSALASLVLGCLFVAAGFAVVAVTTMIVLQKTRDVGTIRALGMSRAGVMRTFVLYGVTTSLAGVGLGLALGALILNRIDWVRQALAWLLGHDVFPITLYGMKTVPHEVSAVVVLVIVGVAVAVSFFGSLLPAWRAARLNVVESLRYE